MCSVTTPCISSLGRTGRSRNRRMLPVLGHRRHFSVCGAVTTLGEFNAVVSGVGQPTYAEAVVTECLSESGDLLRGITVARLVTSSGIRIGHRQRGLPISVIYTSIPRLTVHQRTVLRGTPDPIGARVSGRCRHVCLTFGPQLSAVASPLRDQTGHERSQQGG